MHARNDVRLRIYIAFTNNIKQLKRFFVLSLNESFTGYIRSYLEYVVWYRLSEAAEWRTMKLLSRHMMEATLTNLEAGREYEFMVLSQDRYGDGMFSKAFKYWTKR